MLRTDLLEKFNGWLAEARAHREIKEPTAFMLGTATLSGKPSNRIVLLKEHDAHGFIFYTNYEGRKSEELMQNPHAALCFYWMPLMRQLRIEGRVEKVPDARSARYFAGRPRGSQIGAWASAQSQPLESRETFEARIKDYEQKFEGRDVPRPPFWGGWRVIPEAIEFWEEFEFRRHHRERFEYDPASGEWNGTLLYP